MTVKEYVPTAVGVPLISPVAALSDNPGGNAPDVTAQVGVTESPQADSVNCWEYAVEDVAFGSVVGFT